ncbi:hypothetical protein HYV49_05165 [Candidatus Pacearchaeota archaeon]|nr:hypothetical protein [Candidatus Pacearchaeota archaeon]
MDAADNPNKCDFLNGWQYLQKRVHETAKKKGWWEKERNDGEMLALMHSEISECLEGLRKGNPPDEKIGEFSSAEIELADLVIRLMDMAEGRGWNIAEAIIEKMEYNNKRKYKHGKKF